jgi:hypothetical protein
MMGDDKHVSEFLKQWKDEVDHSPIHSMVELLPLPNPRPITGQLKYKGVTYDAEQLEVVPGEDGCVDWIITTKQGKKLRLTNVYPVHVEVEGEMNQAAAIGWTYNEEGEADGV